MDTNINLLHPLVIKWLYRQRWEKLHDIQEKSIPIIIKGKDDVIISAATASGKTEAALLPACTNLLNNKTEGVQILYISPLKALINDQAKRIEPLGDFLNIKVTPWHGDINHSHKKKTINNPSGIILITPESLESLFMNNNQWCTSSFKNLKYLIIDEFHAFIGTQRGYQLLSLLHRLEIMTNRSIPRIALSATLSNINAVKKWLRPNSNNTIYTIQGDENKKGIKLQIKGYKQDISVLEQEKIGNYKNIAIDIFKICRGSSNLVFVNSRSCAEYITTTLNKLSEQNNLPNEFFTHHSSLSKDIRESIENRLKEGRLPTTAICTQTLELGIDIGDITSISQIQAPQSVASLRQRIGRAGRRDKTAILRLFIPEITVNNTSANTISSELCDETFLSTAMIELVLNRWFEPPTKQEYALSTLIQQTLSVITQYGSVSAQKLWLLLCKTGPFNIVSQKNYADLLRCLGQKDLITQMNNKELVLGLNGEKLISNYSFYSSFKDHEEYTIDNNGTKIGTIPLVQPLSIGDTFLFAGKGWEVIFVNNEKHQILVKNYNQETSPLILDGGIGAIHDAIREKMYELYLKNSPPVYLDKIAKEHYLIGKNAFFKYGLDKKNYIENKHGIGIFTWKGDTIINTIIQLLKTQNIKAKKNGSCIFIEGGSLYNLKQAINKLLNNEMPKEQELAKKVVNIELEKYDHLLSEELLTLQYGTKNFNIKEAITFIKNLNNQLG
ncbi:MAG: DEAD/DEAH box helicase [Succinivibrionaceae bacterium]